MVTIRGNKCDHCQISIHAYNSIVSGNIVTAWGFSAGINTQATAASHDLVVSDNICYNSNQHSDSSPYLPAGIENWAPNSTITGNICYGNFGDGIDNGGASCIIADNICYNNMGYGIYNLYQNAALNASNSLVTGNLLYDSRTSQSRTQIAGYREQSGGLSGIAFADNVCRNNVGSNVYNCVDRISAAQYDWIVPTFQNNWTNFGDNSSGSDAGYYKDANGIVRLRGLIRSGIVPSIAFYLPVGFRPSNPLYFPVASNAAFGLVLISWGGDVEVHTGDSTWVSLDSIAFRAAD